MPDASVEPPAMLPSVVREVEEFVGSAGWDQPPQLFALVPTADLLAAQPELAGSLSDAPVTPVAQDALPDGDLDLALARIMWPDAVRGCALAQEIVVLPPEAEETIADEVGSDESMLRRIAAEHPRRREARLVAAVLRDGTAACVIRLRATDGTEVDQLVEHPELAPNLTDALLRTLRD